MLDQANPYAGNNIGFADDHTKNVGNDTEFKPQVLEAKLFGFNIQYK